jgi:hypothetical protein
VQRSRERSAIVADADRLRALLTGLRAEAGADQRVVVPATVLEKVAGIENAQIARERTAAVLTSVRTVDRGYGLLISREVAEQKAALAPDDRLAVEELIDRALAEPHSTSTIADRAHGIVRVKTPNGTAEIDYHIDDSARRVQVVALRFDVGSRGAH